MLSDLPRTGHKFDGLLSPSVTCRSGISPSTTMRGRRPLGGKVSYCHGGTGGLGTRNFGCFFFGADTGVTDTILENRVL